MEASSLNILVAFFAGLVSFLSPCVLPLVPAYIGYLSGPAVMGAAGGVTMGGAAVRSAAITSSSARWRVMLHSIMFVLGFTIIFVVVIGGLAGTLSDVLRDNKRLVQYVMGVMLVIFGLHMLRIINISFLNYTRRADTAMRRDSNLGYLKSLLIGMGFAIGWTPCIGPTLGLMFTLALNNEQAQAFPLFLSYSLGLGIPFLVAGMAMGQISSGLKKLTRRTYSLNIGSWKAIDQVDIVSLVSGILLLVVGYLVFTNSLTLLNAISPNFGI